MPNKSEFKTNFDGNLIKKTFKKGAPDFINDVMNSTKKDIERGIDQQIDLDGKPFTPLKASTIASKKHHGSATPTKALVNTDKMRNTVISKRATSAKPSGELSVSKKQAEIGKYQHDGTAPYIIEPKRVTHLKFFTEFGYRFAKQVKHTGLPHRPWFGM